MDAWLDRLREGPGRRTFGELIQERQWALSEIQRLRAELGRLRLTDERDATITMRAGQSGREGEQPINPMRLVRMKELKQLLGLSHSTIWKMSKEGRLPKPIHISERATAWRLGDILAWQAELERG